MPKFKKKNRNSKIKKDQYRFTFLGIILVSLMLAVYFLLQNRLEYRSRAQIQDPSSIKLRTMTIPPISISITYPPTPTDIPFVPLSPTNAPFITNAPAAANIPDQPVVLITPAIGGPQPPAGYYCIDDEDPDMCDDNSSHLVPKGSGGVTGTCGTVIEQTHKLVDALPQVMKGQRDSLSKTILNCGYSTGPASNYVSTHLVIDAYNLAGFNELSKNNPTHVSPSGLFSWWQSTPGYTFIPYSPSVIQAFAYGQINLTGCVMFLRTSSSYHIGIVNFLELYTNGGDGVLSILQSGTRMWIDRFPVAGWNVLNDSTNMTYTQGVVGFGCH